MLDRKKFEDDKFLVKEILKNNEAALNFFYVKYNKELFNYIKQRISDQLLVDDIVSEIIIQFLEKLRDFRFQCSLRNYLLSIGRNKVVDFIRKKKIKNFIYTHVPDFIIDESVFSLIDPDIEKNEIRDRVERVFELMPNDYAVVIRLKYIENKSVKEISGLLFKTFKATESLIYRARQNFILAYEKSAQIKIKRRSGS